MLCVSDGLRLTSDEINAAPDKYAHLALTDARKKPSSDFAALFVVLPFNKLMVIFLGQSVCTIRDRLEIGIKSSLGVIQTT